MSAITLIPAQRCDLDDVAAEVRTRYDQGGGGAVLAYVADLASWGADAAVAVALAAYDEIIGGAS